MDTKKRQQRPEEDGENESDNVNKKQRIAKVDDTVPPLCLESENEEGQGNDFLGQYRKMVIPADALDPLALAFILENSKFLSAPSVMNQLTKAGDAESLDLAIKLAPVLHSMGGRVKKSDDGTTEFLPTYGDGESIFKYVSVVNEENSSELVPKLEAEWRKLHQVASYYNYGDVVPASRPIRIDTWF